MSDLEYVWHEPGSRLDVAVLLGGGMRVEVTVEGRGHGIRIPARAIDELATWLDWQLDVPLQHTIGELEQELRVLEGERDTLLQRVAELERQLAEVRAELEGRYPTVARTR